METITRSVTGQRGLRTCGCRPSYSVMSDSFNPMDGSSAGPSVHGISQAGILEWVAISPGDLPNPSIQPGSSTLAGRFFFF